MFCAGLRSCSEHLEIRQVAAYYMCAGLVGGEPGLRPVIGLQMEFGNGIALLARDQIDLRQKLALSRTLSVEVPATCLSLDTGSLHQWLLPHDWRCRLHLQRPHNGMRGPLPSLPKL